VNMVQMNILHPKAKVSFHQGMNGECNIFKEQEGFDSANAMQECRINLESVFQQVMPFFYHGLVAVVDGIT
jgi:hypothetical protein